MSVAKAWIDEARTDGLHKRYHCMRRFPWYLLPEPERPDAFLPYMGTAPPRLVVNSAASASTNAVHGVRWRSRSTGRRAVLSSWTTLYGLGVELLGRTYGSGVLKIEPSAALSLPIVRLKSSKGLSQVDAAARHTGRNSAVALADVIVLVDHLRTLRERHLVASRVATVAAGLSYPPPLDLQR